MLIILVLFAVLNFFTAFFPMIYLVGKADLYYSKIVHIFVPNQYYIDKMEADERKDIKEQKRKYAHLITKKLFDTIDIDRSGTISKEEYRIYVSQQMVKEYKGKFETLVKECDTNHDGKVKLDEASKLMRNGTCKLSMKDFIYSDLDKDSSTISTEELKHILKKESDSKKKKSLLQMSFADKNNDGVFDFDEFQKRITYGCRI